MQAIATFTEQSHPEFRTDQRAAAEVEVSRLAKAIDAHRQGLKPVPSDRSWLKDWPGLGSAKTWAKILKGDFEAINAEMQLAKYRGVLSALEAENKERSNDELYGDLAPAEALTLAALQLMHHHGKDRFILVEGGSGSGKTSALRVLSQNEAAGSMVIVEACEVTWRSPRSAIKDILRGLGVGEERVPNTTGDMVDLLLKTLEARGRIILAIDEAHHLTGNLLNLLKTLLNRTEVLIILAGMNTLFQKLRAVASEEAKQLIHNRMFMRIEFGSPDAEGAGRFLARRLGVGEDQWKTGTVKRVVDCSRNSGHWAYLRRVVDILFSYGATGTEADDATLLEAATNAQAEIS